MTYLKPRWPLLVIVTIFAVIGVFGFGSLGVWQIKRLAWKTDLIERVDARVHAPAVSAPSAPEWANISREGSEYLHVTMNGTFLNDDEVQVYTPTDWGPGYWVLTPLQRDDGSIVIVNRGLISEEYKSPTSRPAPEGPQVVNGLLRITEDKGWLFSQPNQPEIDKWHLRDVKAIAAAKGLTNVAPYFVDQELLDPTAWPRGGQTVLSFRNSHLSYALTWFALTLFVAGAWGFVVYTEFRRRPENDE